MKINLYCRIFGHKFHGEKVEFEPHYLKLVEKGIAIMRTDRDFHLVGFQTDYCVNCGLSKKELLTNENL